jgi:pSer/pThr/pTyr-binding forkhead associated (FHA) protein
MQSIPVQSWTFEQEPVIRIGRSTSNHVILYSAVVSRHHVELRKVDSGWEIVNLGANGTYLDGRRITQVPVQDGVIIRLARSGPNVQIHLGTQSAESARGLLGEKTVGQVKPTTQLAQVGNSNSELDLAMQAALDDPAQPQTHATLSEADRAQTPAINPADVAGAEIAADPNNAPGLLECCQRYVNSENFFCLECGKPLRAIATLGDYQVLRTLEEGDVEVTQLVWREGQTFNLISINSEWVDHPEANELFAQEAEHLVPINHPALPRFVDRFVFKDQPYLVMQPVYGQSLQRSVAAQGALTSAEAIAIILKVCDALTYLHHQPLPVIHQAINPANIIRRSAATQDITLVGLSPYRSLDASLHYNPAGYRAPEQKQSQFFPATDLYAIAPTLVYLLTGKEPSNFYAHREQGYRFYPEYVPGLPANLVPILRKLTNPEPEERFDSAEELAQALKNAGG